MDGHIVIMFCNEDINVIWGYWQLAHVILFIWSCIVINDRDSRIISQTTNINFVIKIILTFSWKISDKIPYDWYFLIDIKFQYNINIIQIPEFKKCIHILRTYINIKIPKGVPYEANHLHSIQWNVWWIEIYTLFMNVYNVIASYYWYVTLGNSSVN